MQRKYNNIHLKLVKKYLTGIKFKNNNNDFVSSNDIIFTLHNFVLVEDTNQINVIITWEEKGIFKSAGRDFSYVLKNIKCKSWIIVKT